MNPPYKTDTDLLIIGAGASGLAAACSAASAGASVIAADGNDRPGRKLSVTGNGRCNLSNTDMDLRHFHSNNPERVRAVLDKCPPAKTLSGFDARDRSESEYSGDSGPRC